MNIHEYQAKEILKKFGAKVPNGVPIISLSEVEEKSKLIKSDKIVLKAQIHAGGRGKAGGIKIVNNVSELIIEAKKFFGKKLITNQTGPQGREVKRLYIEEVSDIEREFYLSCLVDRSSSKIAFISSAEGGTDIETIANKYPEIITTRKLNLFDTVTTEDMERIIEPFNLFEKSKKQATDLIKSIHATFLKTDASLIEINPLILSKDKNIICLDAKISFDDNALYKHPEILSLRDFNEEDPMEIEASKHDLAYIKLDGKIGCMVIIKLYGSEPANFLDVGGGASKEKVSAAFKIILSDKNVKGILVNIFGGIMRCDVIAQGILDAAKKINLSVPLVVRLAGTNVELGKEILKKSDLKIISAKNLSEAAQKIVEAVR